MDVAVGVGTIALAIVAAVGLLFSLRATGEAYRSRIDATAQRVVITSLFLGDVKAASKIGFPQPVKPGTAWVMAQYGNIPLIIDAGAVIDNEGSVTAFVRVNDSTLNPAITWIGVGNVTSVNGMDAMLTNQEAVTQDGWTLIPPGRSALLHVSWSRPAHVWWEEFLSGTGEYCPTRTFTVEIRDATGSALDSCQCEFGRVFVGRNPTGDGCVILTPPSPTSPFPRVESVGRIVRTYPLESARRLRAKSR